MPSAFMSHRFQVPARVLAKATLDPSGDQAGSLSSALDEGSGEIWFWPLPSGFIVQMRNLLPGVARSYAILVPSGDQAGCCSVALVHVSRRSELPSDAIE